MRGRRYAILPLDEDYFTIHANERAIDIPDNFKKHGVAVQGDETAEIIYFKINRYFDFMDLNNTEIYIQWQQGLGENANTGLSNEWVRDIESDPDYLIFGWALDSSITNFAGTLKFSVRFIDWKTDPVTGEYVLDSEGNRIIGYSLSTKERDVGINAGLNLNITPTNISEIEQMISRRVKRARVVGTDKADVPQYTLTLLDHVLENQDYVIDQNGNYQVDLKTLEDIEGNEFNGYDFKVQAYSPDAGHIIYSWYDMNTSKTTPIENTEDSYEPITASIDKPFVTEVGHIYYTLKDGEYVPDTTITSGKDTITDNKHYERYGQFIATQAGKYIAVATNDIRFDSAVLPVISQEDKIEATYGPIEIPGATDAIISLADGVKYTDYIIGKTNTELVPTIALGNEKDVLSYQWYRKWKDVEKERIDGAINPTYKVEDGRQGYYFIEVTSSRNNNTKTVPSKEFLVTMPAMKPIITYDKTDVNVGDEVKVTVTFDGDYQEHLNRPEYQWYKVKLNSEEPVEGANSYSFTPTDNGNYKCKVTNTYNGDVVEAISQNYITAYDI